VSGGVVARAPLARATRLARAPGVTLALALLAAMSFLLNLALGAVDIPAWSVVGVLADHAGLGLGGAFTPEQDAVVWQIRLPRAALAALVGAGLAVSGAALQGIFRNPSPTPG
jgi:iron complex transport system permease protein